MKTLIRYSVARCLVATILLLICCSSSAMIIGKGQKLTCPHCKTEKVIRSILSGNTFGARLWSDLKLEATMMPRPSFVQKCPSCHKYYTLSSQEEEPRYSDTEEGKSFGHLSYDEWKEAMKQFTDDNSFGENDEEATIRILFTHAYNDYHFRGVSIIQPSADDKQLFIQNAEKFLKDDNLIISIDIMLFKAEMFRECGRFEESKKYIESIKYKMENYNRERLETIMLKAEEKDCLVFLFK